MLVADRKPALPVDVFCNHRVARQPDEEKEPCGLTTWTVAGVVVDSAILGPWCSRLDERNKTVQELFQLLFHGIILDPALFIEDGLGA